jgi:hypothetical protein
MATDLPADGIYYDVDYGNTDVGEWFRLELRNVLLKEVHESEMKASVESVKAKLRDMVDEELIRAAAAHLDHKNVRGDKGRGSQE